MLRSSVVVMAVAVALSGCGTTKEDRAVSGAGIGAGAGAVVGAVTGLTVVEGALIGAAVGGVTGLATDESQVNLGKPVWKGDAGAGGSAPTTAQQPSSAQNAGPNQQTAYATPADSDTIRSIQSGLVKLGFDPGPVDGVAGSKTRSAIRAYQQQNGLAPDGLPSADLAAHIQQKVAAK
ncbi:MAG: peptidoglycan-binding domain-containing protein [Alphaproteobacteria bacterium]